MLTLKIRYSKCTIISEQSFTIKPGMSSKSDRLDWQTLRSFTIPDQIEKLKLQTKTRRTEKRGRR